MKTNYLLSSLCLAPLAPAAPVAHTVTLVAGKSVWRPGHHIATFLEEVQQHVVISKNAPHTTEQSGPSTILDSDRPMTTAELLALSKAQSQPAPPQQVKSPKAKSKPGKDGSKKISVGALVVPDPSRVSVVGRIYYPESSPYLIPGQYVASQRADVLIVGLILACVLIVIAMESWELICNFFANGIFKRQGSIRLAEDSAADLEQGRDRECDDDDDCDAPFGGFRKQSTTSEEGEGTTLPETVDEKAALI